MKRISLITAIIAVAASLALGQTRVSGDGSRSVRNAIEASNQKFIEAFNRGDAAGIAAMYASDAWVLPPNSQAVEGRQNIQSFWQSLISMGAKIGQLETIRVESRGDIAYEVGKYTLTIQPAGGQPVTDMGKYVVVWRRQGGAWKLAADIWNTNAPLTGP